MPILMPVICFIIMINIWLLFLAAVLFFLSSSQEGFSLGTGKYPNIYHNYKTDDWHQYWHDAKKMRVPTKFEKYVPGAPSYSCNQCYYPMKMPFN